MWIKICANTNLEDALLASEMGADAVGFVFAPSSRRVTPAQAADVTARLPNSLETVGIFPVWPAERIVKAVEQTGIASIQLHGSLDPELARILHHHFDGQVSIIQVVHWAVDAQGNQARWVAEQLKELVAMPEIDRILIDSKVGSNMGGTGTAFPWADAKELFASHPKVILAGGLTLSNVAEAIDQLAPWGVDVASGVEASPGKKNTAKLQAFIRAARTASKH